MPRLSVGIDLTYLPVKGREESLKEMSDTLREIARDIKKHVVESTVQEIEIQNPRMVSKLNVSRKLILG